MPGQQVREAVPHGFADAPLHPIAYHRFAHPLSYRDTQPCRLTIVRRDIQDEERMPPRAAHRAHPLEVGWAAEAMLASHGGAILAVRPIRPSDADAHGAADGATRDAHHGMPFA